MKTKNNSGFSVLELLSVIAIILIVASFLTGAIHSAREKGRMAICINNLKNLTAALIMSATDTDAMPTELAYHGDASSNSYPEIGTAYAGVSAYYDNQMAITKCPNISGMMTDGTPIYSYGINQLVRGVSYHKIDSPSEVIIMSESSKRVLGKANEVDFRHLGRAYAGFADGHVELVKFAQLGDASEDVYGSTVSEGASGNGVLFEPEAAPMGEEEPPYVEIPFSFTTDSVCANGFKWDFLGLTDNGDGTKTLSFNITNFNNKALSNASFGLPEGVDAAWPENGSLYTMGNKTYQVENTTENPFHAIKYNTIAEGIKNGGVDNFSFTLNDADVGSVIIMRVQSKGGQITGGGQFEAGEPGGDGTCPD